MASINTSNNFGDDSSPKMSTHLNLNQIKNSPQPLRFRSFDAFYQHYSKKNTFDNVHSKSPSNSGKIHITTLKDKKDSANSDNNQACRDLNSVVTYSTEDYNIKGRVKRLCEIFQKAHNDSNFRQGLENVISKNKTIKSFKAPATPRANLNVIANPTNIDVTDVEFDFKPTDSLTTAPETSDSNVHATNHNTPVQIYTKRDQNTRPNVSLSPLKVKPDLITGSEESIFNINLSSPSLIREPPAVVKKHDAPSPKAVTPTKSSSFKYISPTKTTAIRYSHSFDNSHLRNKSALSNEQSMDMTPTNMSHDVSNDSNNLTKADSMDVDMDKLSHNMDNLSLDASKIDNASLPSTQASMSDHNFARQDSDVSVKIENEAIINDILTRFMHDPEFCNSFFTKLESCNLDSKAATLEFSKVIDELQFLVENDNANFLESDEQRKNFEWFFKQPKVFDFNLSEQGSLQVSTSIEQTGSRDSASLIGDESTPRTRDYLKESDSSNNIGSYGGLTLTDTKPASCSADVDLSPASLDLESVDPNFGEVNPEMAKHFDWIKDVK